MKNLESPVLIKIKGLLFLVVALFSSALLLIEHPHWKDAFLLAISIWASSRFYYFAFYVMERYVESNYRFSGLISLGRYLIAKRR